MTNASPAALFYTRAAIIAVITSLVAVVYTRWTVRRALGHDNIADAIGQEFIRQVAIDMGLEDDYMAVFRFRR